MTTFMKCHGRTNAYDTISIHDRRITISYRFNNIHSTWYKIEPHTHICNTSVQHNTFISILI